VLRTLSGRERRRRGERPAVGLSKEPDIAEVMRHWLAGDRYEHVGAGFMGKSWTRSARARVFGGKRTGS